MDSFGSVCFGISLTVLGMMFLVDNYKVVDYHRIIEISENNSCKYGIEKIYLDYDYDCKVEKGK